MSLRDRSMITISALMAQGLFPQLKSHFILGKKHGITKQEDVVTIPANVKHWHGATAKSWFSHIAVEVPGENTSNEWCEKVTDEEYNKLPE
jgi:alkylhydroperoxidase/carboxymuconolactone decarboxylase family protein YurZ